MSSGMKPDLAQKLLNDLKMRKERMANTHSSANSSIMSADAYGSSRRSSLKGSTDMKPLAKASSNTPKLQRSSNRSHSSHMKTANSSQIVPYGNTHASNQPLDMSMTLSYALDNNGNLKKMNLTGSSAMIGLLRRISRKSMDGSVNSQIQWPSSAQFPTLTNLHVDEVSKGAQRLNQILKSFYNGLNSNGYTVDMGKELLKGACELEESLRMLVSLQEASEYMVVPQRKSRVKLLEISEDAAEGNEKKNVERPVFSFDKRVKNEKKTTAIKHVNSHRRSASCGAELRNSPVTASSSQRVGISNVVAKLMGLEEISHNEGNQLTQSSRVLDRTVSERMRFGGEEAWRIGLDSKVKEGTRSSNKIVILTSKKIEQQKETDERKADWRSQREKEQIMTRVMQVNKRSGNGEELKEKVLGRKEKPVNPVQGKSVSKENGNEKRSASKVLEREKKSMRDGKLQRVETQKRNQKLERRSSKTGLNKTTTGRKTEASENVIENSSPKDIHEVKSSQTSLKPVGQAKDVLLDHATFKNSVSTKEESLVKLKQDQGFSFHQEEVKSQVNGSNSLKMAGIKKANEVMAKPASRQSRATKQQATILQGFKQRKPVDKRSQLSRQAESEATAHKFQSCEAIHGNKPVMPEEDQESNPQISELIQVSGNQKEALYKVLVDIKQQPLTNEETYLKQKLLTSQVFLNTAEALFKLNIPIGVLNASDIIACQEKEEDTKQITDCAYEMLKMKGKRRELVLYPCKKNTLISKMRLGSLDDLVRELHKDFEKLKTYGKTSNSEYDQVEYLLKMLERDVFHGDMDVNCMWDMGWKNAVFAYVEMDEVIRDVEKYMINKLIDDVLEGFMEMNSLPIIHGENMRTVWQLVE